MSLFGLYSERAAVAAAAAVDDLVRLSAIAVIIHIYQRKQGQPPTLGKISRKHSLTVTFLPTVSGHGR